MGAILGKALTGVGAFTIGSLASIGGQLSQVLIIFLFFLMLRVFFTLAKAYLTILLLLILGPIIITMGAISGTGPFKSWFFNVLANVIVFPVIGFILTISQFLQSVIISNPPGAFWSAPYIGIDRGVLSGAIGLGVLLMVPEIPNIIQSFLKTQFPEVVPVQQLMQTFQQVRPPQRGQAVSTGETLGSPLRGLRGLFGGGHGPA